MLWVARDRPHLAKLVVVIVYLLPTLALVGAAKKAVFAVTPRDRK
jgi:hypothetical protein